MVNVIILLVLIAIASGSIWYLLRAKKRGEACIGCPHAKLCGSKCSGGCSCSNQTQDGQKIHN